MQCVHRVYCISLCVRQNPPSSSWPRTTRGTTSQTQTDIPSLGRRALAGWQASAPARSCSCAASTRRGTEKRPFPRAASSIRQKRDQTDRTALIILSCCLNRTALNMCASMLHSSAKQPKPPPDSDSLCRAMPCSRGLVRRPTRLIMLLRRTKLIASVHTNVISSVTSLVITLATALG